MDNREKVEYLFYLLRQTVDRAREAKAMGWPRLCKYSIKSSEKLIVEIEELL